MDSRKITRLLVFTAFLTAFSTIIYAAQDANTSPTPPYYAEITSNDVYVRSGPGTQHYFTGKLSKGDTVKVLSHKFTWSLITPTKGSFSWISKQYITIDKTNPDTGIVTGDEVKVYAGSEFIAPIHSDRVQLTLNKGSKVTLLGEEIGDYYKIAPPEGAYLWVSTEYTKPVPEPVRVQPGDVVQQPISKPVAAPGPPAMKTVDSNMPSVVPTSMSGESEQLKQYYNLQQQAKLESTKPLAEQDYSKIKASLEQLAQDKNAGKAARYAKFTLEQIGRYELAAEVEKQSKLQQKQLQELYQGIDSSLEAKLSEISDTSRHAIVGTFKASNVYGPQRELLRYVITNPAGKVICYAVPVGYLANSDLSAFFGKKVGLVGAIEPYPPTMGALVRFTEIEFIE